MIISCNTVVDWRDHVQYPTVSKSYSDNFKCSLTEQNTTLKNLYYHTGQYKSTGGCYNELVVAYFSTCGGVKWRKR